MVQFIAPIALFAGKKLVVLKASNEVEERVNNTIVSTLLNIFINIIALSIAIYILPLFYSKEATIYVICSVYLSSILYGAYSTIQNIPEIYKLFIMHKLNLKTYIESEVANEIPIPIIDIIIAKSTTARIFKKIIRKILVIAIIFTIYVIIFRVLVAPVLIENTTNFNWLQAALYPLLYSVDYFFNTDYCANSVHYLKDISNILTHSINFVKNIF